MKKFISVSALLVCQLLFVSVCSAQDKKEQLWLVGEEVVKPAMVNQYLEINKELLSICNEEKFPFTFNLFTTGDFKYHLWYPIENMNDLTRIADSWDSLAVKYGAEKFKRFNECLDYNTDRFAVTRLDLSYEPAESRLNDNEGKYCRWQELYLKKGHEDDVEALIRRFTALLKEKKFDDAVYFGYGRVGYENPVLFVWSFAKDINDYWAQDKIASKLLGDELEEINMEFLKHIRKAETKDVWWLENLSFTHQE